MLGFDWRRWRFGGTAIGGRTATPLVIRGPGAGVGFGGAAAMETTDDLIAGAPVLVGVLADVVEVSWLDPSGEATSWAPLMVLLAGGVVAGVWVIEFLREAFFDDLVDDPVGIVVPDPRLRFLMTSVFSESGRTTPCNFRKSPQALQSGWPSGLRRQSGVV